MWNEGSSIALRLLGLKYDKPDFVRVETMFEVLEATVFDD